MPKLIFIKLISVAWLIKLSRTRLLFTMARKIFYGRLTLKAIIYMKVIGIELFQDVPTDFMFDGIEENLQQIKLPMEYSRNITMIYKELLNNVLKHADAKHVILQWAYFDKHEINLRLTDDGRGFNNDTI